LIAVCCTVRLGTITSDLRTVFCAVDRRTGTANLRAIGCAVWLGTRAACLIAICCTVDRSTITRRVTHRHRITTVTNWGTDTNPTCIRTTRGRIPRTIIRHILHNLTLPRSQHPPYITLQAPHTKRNDLPIVPVELIPRAGPREPFTPGIHRHGQVIIPLMEVGVVDGDDFAHVAGAGVAERVVLVLVWGGKGAEEVG